MGLHAQPAQWTTFANHQIHQLSKFKSFSTTFNNHWANLCFSDVQNMTQPLLPQKKTYPLKNYGWKMNLRFEMVPFQVIWVFFGEITQLVKSTSHPKRTEHGTVSWINLWETGTRHHVFQGWSARPVEVRIFRMREVCNSTSITIQSTINLPMLSMLSNVQLLGIAHLLMSQISRYWEVDWGWGISGRFSTRPFWRPFFLCEKCPRITRAIV